MSMSKCVVLVPVGGSIEPACEEGLRELERRGYEVRRVRGFSQIDVARNQIATDALAAGFDETMWIDSDVGFHPDDVERLRQHGLPICCGIYPKKGLRELACHVMPGTQQIVFGRGGGLVELRYAATGFLHVRKEVYTAVREKFGLPICNRRFGQPMIPFFQPLAIPDDLSANGDETWYLGEDYAFCERVRQSGFQIMADTTIRLRHFGNYPYQWEDSGYGLERFDNFSLHLGGEISPPPGEPLAGPPVSKEPGWLELVPQSPWPPVPPNVPPNPEHGWLFPSTKTALERHATREIRLIVEIGAWLGLSTRWLAQCAPQAGIISIDTWRGSPEHQADRQWREMLPTLFQTWQVNCWKQRAQLLPLRMRSLQGLPLIHQAGLRPDLVFIDGDHSYAAVVADLTSTLELFPKAVIVGDDWDWTEVQRAVVDVCTQRSQNYQVEGTAWIVDRQ